MSPGPGGIEDLQRRVADLEAILAIQALKARYAQLVDARYERGAVVDPTRLAKLARDVGTLFTQDATWDGGPSLGVASGRDEIEARMRAPTLRFSRHLFLSPKIAVDGDRATGRWELLSPITTADGVPRWMVGVEDDTYARTDGVWQHASMRLTTTFVGTAGQGWPQILG